LAALLTTPPNGMSPSEMVLFLCVAYNAARGVKQSGRPVRTCPLHKLLLAWAAKP